MTPRVLDIANRIARGQTVRQIANDLGVTRTAVYMTLYRHKIRLPQPRASRQRKPDPNAPRPDWSHPSPELVELAHAIRHEILAAWQPDA